MRKILFFLMVCLFLGMLTAPVHTQEIDSVLLQELRQYILANQTSPENYVIEKFMDHDVVILGEFHYVKHDPILIQKLIPLLHQKQVYNLAIEFARREDQPLIDSLLSASVYDESLAKKIQFQQMVTWAYQEYLDIYKFAWELNHSLAKDARKFRILGVGCSPDWSVMKTPADRDVDSLKRLAWKGCTEKDWAAPVLEQTSKGEKILAYCGMHHAFSEYLQPIVDGQGKFIRFEDMRFGRYLFESLGKRVLTIALHGPWYAGSYDRYVRPANGVIDSVMQCLGSDFKPVGFDVKESPFEKLLCTDNVYANGYTRFTPAVFCDGWIFQKQFKDYETVTYIEDFINDANLEYARRHSASPSHRNYTLDGFRLKGKLMLENMRKLYNSL